MACSLGKEGECSTIYSRIKVIKVGEGIALPIVCLQCEDAICEKVCPVRAISKNPNGIVVVDYELCIGCKACLALCPLGVITLDPKRKRIVKCDLCNGEPRCVKFCQPKAIEFVRKDLVDMPKRRSIAEKIYAVKSAMKKPLVQKIKI